jgi:hypothetical protein
MDTLRWLAHQVRAMWDGDTTDPLDRFLVRYALAALALTAALLVAVCCAAPLTALLYGGVR